MTHKQLVFALSMFVAVTPLSAAQPRAVPEGGAPAAAADARYCLRIEPITGSRMETIRCETREAWAELDIDVDTEWAKEGVKVVT